MVESGGVDSDVMIVGGGLAGLTAAIHLCKAGLSITVIEKGEYPRQKVCGEYLSAEVVPYLSSLGINLQDLTPVVIDTLTVSLVSGKELGCSLPLGGVGISRKVLDDYLYQKAKSSGAVIIHDTVTDITFDQQRFSLATNQRIYSSRIVLGATGKRSTVDIRLKRKFIMHKTPWLAVKAHYKVQHEANVVGLHNFPGGYCGVSKVESGDVNVCYLAHNHEFSKSKNIEDFQERNLSCNPHLKPIFQSQPLFKPLAIAQISFEEKTPVENHILMIGDCAGVIHPLCGNGMAMAVHSAKIACEAVIKYLSREISRSELEENYTRQWNRNFKRRIIIGHRLSWLMRQPAVANSMMTALTLMPSIMPQIIKRTHGKIIPEATW